MAKKNNLLAIQGIQVRIKIKNKIELKKYYIGVFGNGCNRFIKRVKDIIKKEKITFRIGSKIQKKGR
ncbi:MAG: hypothetical protein U5K51_00980 [Flavobacteriaceae bacterium]|nr:hypothetical protein [Flavobacteriaceae bacterium]